MKIISTFLRSPDEVVPCVSAVLVMLLLVWREEEDALVAPVSSHAGSRHVNHVLAFAPWTGDWRTGVLNPSFGKRSMGGQGKFCLKKGLAECGQMPN